MEWDEWADSAERDVVISEKQFTKLSWIHENVQLLKCFA